MARAELRRVLIIENDPSARSILLTLLAELGCDTELAYSAQRAIGKIQSERFDAVLLDLRYANLEANEIVSGIRSIQPSLLANVLVITGEVADAQTLDLIEEHLLLRVSGSQPIQDTIAALRVLLRLPLPFGSRTM
jgi:CheY-like chemotaxis protein